MTTTTNAQRAKGDGSAEAAPLHVEHLPIADLHPDPRNPRRIAEAELAALTRSIATFGCVDPVLARRADRRVIAGHQRLVAARRAGLTTVPVILLDLTAADARLLNVALNRIGGEWDQDLLARLLIDLRATAARDLTLSGFAEPDLQDLLTRFDQREKRDRPERFDLEEALATYDREASGIAPGAGWQLGAHRLFRGDATDAAFVARCLGGQPADLVFTDPPSNVAYGAHGGKAAVRPARRLCNDALPVEAWERFCRAWAASLTANAAGVLYICMSSRRERRGHGPRPANRERSGRRGRAGVVSGRRRTRAGRNPPAARAAGPASRRPTPSRARRPPACSDRRGSARLGERSPGGRVGHAGPARHRLLVRSAEASGRRRRWAGALRAPGGPRFALRHCVPSFAANPLRRRQ